MIMKLFYFLYTIKKTNYKKLNTYIQFVCNLKRTHKVVVIIDFLKDFFKYNTLFLDYFYFRFFEIDQKLKKTYIDTLFMYRFQRRFNNKKYIRYFADKILFYQKFAPYIHHHIYPLKTLDSLKRWIYKYKPDGIVCKNNLGQVGSNIEVYKVEVNNNQIQLNNQDIFKIYKHLKRNKLNLIEEKVKQHSVLEKIYPDSLNTVRIISFLKESGEVEILGAILRMGYDKTVDNFDAGGISVVIELDGEIRKKAVVKNPIINRKFVKHPHTKNNITGTKIPYWNNVINLVKNAAKEVPEVRTVGWDVIISNDGVSLLEGNHNWDKTHWQLCYGKGMKEIIKNLIGDESKNEK